VRQRFLIQRLQMTISRGAGEGWDNRRPGRPFVLVSVVPVFLLEVTVQKYLFSPWSVSGPWVSLLASLVLRSRGCRCCHFLMASGVVRKGLGPVDDVELGA